jgi:hypothetical protein
MRDFRLFAHFDQVEEGVYKVSVIRNEGDRTLFLQHRMHGGVPLHHATK